MPKLPTKNPILQQKKKKIVNEFLQKKPIPKKLPSKQVVPPVFNVLNVVKSLEKTTISVIIPMVAQQKRRLSSATITLQELKRIMCQSRAPKDIKVEAILVASVLRDKQKQGELIQQFSCLNFDVKFVENVKKKSQWAATEQTQSETDTVEDLLNVGSRVATGRYLLFTTPNAFPLQSRHDKESGGSWLSDMVHYIKEVPDRKIIGAKILNNDNLVRSAGMDAAFEHMDNPVLFDRFVGFSPNDTRVNTEGAVLAVGIPGMMIERDAFVRAGEFDKNFGEYAAQHLCFKVAKSDGHIRYFPKAVFMVDEPTYDRTDIYHDDDFAETQINSLSQLPSRKSKQKKKGEDVFMKEWAPELRKIILKQLQVSPNTTVVWDFGAGSCMYIVLSHSSF